MKWSTDDQQDGVLHGRSVGFDLRRRGYSDTQVNDSFFVNDS